MARDLAQNRNRIVLLAISSLALAVSACSGGDGEGPGSGGGVPGDSDGGAGAGSGMTPGGVRWVGRVESTAEGGARLAWQGAGLVAVVAGPSIAVTLRTEGADTVFFQPVIDGVPGARFEVRQGGDRTVSLGSGLEDGDHQVELYRDTEAIRGDVSTFLGFASGTVRGAPTSNGRRLEVVGDSISAGYGDLGQEPHPGWVASPACHWTAENSSWYSTYGAIAGRALRAEVSTLALSGWGLYRDGSGGTAVLPSVYEKALGPYDGTPWGFEPSASAVVINLGTNDMAAGGFSSDAYASAGVSFVHQIRARYPEAWIFLTIGSMLSETELDLVKGAQAAVVSAVQAAGDSRVSSFDLGMQDLGDDGSVPTGCDWHPSAADHARMASILADQLRAKLGW
jgi:lysophospholipase L1-like esterase